MAEILTPEWFASRLPAAHALPGLWALAADSVLHWLRVGPEETVQVVRGELLRKLQTPVPVLAEWAERAYPVESLREALTVPEPEAPAAAPGALRLVVAEGLDLALRRIKTLGAVQENVERDRQAGILLHDFAAECHRAQEALREALGEGAADPAATFDEVLARLAGALEGFRFDAVAQFIRGWLELLHRGAPAEALEAFEGALQLRRVDPDFRAYLLRHIAACHYARGQTGGGAPEASWEAAVEAATAAVQLAPEDSALRFELARYCALAGRTDEAARHLSVVHEAQPLACVDTLAEAGFAELGAHVAEVFEALQARAQAAARGALEHTRGVLEEVRRLHSLAGTLYPGENGGGAGRVQGTGGLDLLESAEELAAQGSYLAALEAAAVAREGELQAREEAHERLTLRLIELETARARLAAVVAARATIIRQRSQEAAEHGQEADARSLATTPRARFGGGYHTYLLFAAAALLAAGVVAFTLGGQMRLLGLVMVVLAVGLGLPALLGPSQPSPGQPPADKGKRGAPGPAEDPGDTSRPRDQVEALTQRIANVEAALRQLPT